VRAADPWERIAPMAVEDEEEVPGRRVPVQTREAQALDRRLRRHPDRVVPVLSEPEGARFRLVKAGDDWRIDSGYTLD
jgi:hypothetical protein